ncbi:RHS repeat domain-containing protein [Rubrivivax rivuli]|nr:RHS repeat-associated core domain-containing protein [Rubrivivax rivuli]
MYSEQHRKVRGSSNVDALGPNLFGDQVSLYSGRIEFVQQDLDIPGNNTLPVGIARRLTSGRDLINNAGMFGDWDLEIPRLQGIFAVGSRNFGWAVGDYAPDYYKRCSQFSAPPVGRAMISTGLVWEPDEYWFGTNLYMPGQGSQPLLQRAPGNTLQPSTGSYPLVTKSGWQIQCLGSISNNQGAGHIQGEAFSALAPDGTRWRFDHLVQRRTTTLTKPSSSGGAGGAGGASAPGSDSTGGTRTERDGRVPIFEPMVTMGHRLERAEFWMLPTQAVDRFGNTLTFSYDPANPWRLLAVTSSDGRTLSFTHDGTSQRIRTVFDGTRTWTYEYTGSTLSRVVRPDNSAWQFINADPFKNVGVTYAVNPGCATAGELITAPQTVTMVHPSGASGAFTIQSVHHGRTDVPQRCIYAGGTSRAATPIHFADRSIVSKTLSGPGMPTATWAYAYSAPAASWAPCGAGCNPRKTVSVTDPAGVVTRSTFGTRFGVDEGRLLLEETVTATGAVMRSVATRYRSPAAGPYPDPVGYSVQLGMDNNEATRHAPADQRTVSQQGSTFIWQADAFDQQARATQVTRSSSLGHTRTETTAYHDHLGLWVLGQVASVTTPWGLVPEQHEYDPVTALRTRSYAFGLLKQRLDHHPDGTLRSKADAVNPPTVMTNYHRGVPRNVTYPDGSSERADVNNLGLVTAVTNAFGTTTHYGYDAIGRLATIVYPPESTGGYHATLQTYEQVQHDEWGLAAGHWRQTTQTGNNKTVRYFDGMWRERLRYQQDTTNPAGTGRTVETRYDADGRKVFESYPQRSLANVDTYRPGQSWEHDALDRVTVQRQDSELGVLTSTTEYLNNFQKRVTNPRGHATTFSYQVFDQPSEDSITGIGAPEGVSVSIPRDAFGKALSITRSGTWAGSGVSATRSYVYDAHQRLCKTVEPETGATIQAYDVASNIAWRASGQSATGTGSCDQAAVGGTAKISFGYDALNRLTSTTFGDGQPGISRSYTPDGLLQQTVSSSFTWTYSYNNRRLLTQEALSVPNQTPGAGWNFSYTHDSHGHLHTLTDPWGPVTYAPNALGEPTQASGYVGGVSYHPNGAVAGYTLATGVVRSISLNTRGLPAQWQDTGVMHDSYTYDANGNVTGIQDVLQGVNTRSMGYDGLDRLTTANGPWGSGQYQYDALDNLTYSQLGARSVNHNIDPATNRLTSLSGSQSVLMGYDGQGNVTQRGAQSFSFDKANRLRTAWGKAHYDYDGHGRRSWTVNADGSTQLNAYTGLGAAGQLRFSNHSVQGGVRYVYLGSQLIAEHKQDGRVIHFHTDALGSPVARTNGPHVLLDRTRYEPYGATVAGSFNPTGIGFTGHVNDADTGLVYMQQRYYDPLAGRFLSVDPVTTNSSTGSSFNRYNYAENNPYKFVDPDGRASCADKDCRTSTIDSEIKRADGGTTKITFVNDNPKGASTNQPISTDTAKTVEAVIAKANVDSININSTTGGDHSKTSAHHSGRAVDINRIDGKQVGADNPGGERVQKAAQSDRNVRENFGPSIMEKRSDADKGPVAVNDPKLTAAHRTHIHISTQPRQ